MVALNYYAAGRKGYGFQDCYSAELETLEVAYNRFNNISAEDVEPELLDAVMYELKAAELKLEVAARQAKAMAENYAARGGEESKKENNVKGTLRAGYTVMIGSLSSAFKNIFAAFMWFQRAGSK